MKEAHLQGIVIESMRDVCKRYNTTLRHEVTSSSVQSPANEKGKPYDVGVLLRECYLVGLEFKVLENGALSSWDDVQHQAYLALTLNARLQLPLFYSYNVPSVPTLNEFLTHTMYDDVLTGTRISQPKNLPGKRPHWDEHPTILTWLTALLENPEGLAGNGWPFIVLSNNLVFEKFKGAFPSVIWLLVSSNPKFRVSWVLTHSELLQEISAMEQLWKRAELRHIDEKSDASQAFDDAVTVIADYADYVAINSQKQISGETDMDDRPMYDGTPKFDDTQEKDSGFRP